MRDIAAALEGTRDAVREMVDLSHACEPVWGSPRAPGKWTPGQVVEHVARALEQSAHVAAGRPSTFPAFPSLLRPVARGLFFQRVLRNGAFFKARTSRAMNPDAGPATVGDGCRRLETAMDAFDEACRACAAGSGRVASSLFGDVDVVDFVRFQELHVRHHSGQLAAQRDAAVTH